MSTQLKSALLGAQLAPSSGRAYGALRPLYAVSGAALRGAATAVVAAVQPRGALSKALNAPPSHLLKLLTI